MNRLVDFTPTQLGFLAFMCGTALIMGGYLLIRTYAWSGEDVPPLEVVLSTEAAEYRGTFLIDPNSAPADSLELLPGIGPALADSIVKYRELMHFETVEDLDKVGGIGPKTLDKIRPYLKTGDR